MTEDIRAKVDIHKMVSELDLSKEIVKHELNEQAFHKFLYIVYHLDEYASVVGKGYDGNQKIEGEPYYSLLKRYASKWDEKKKRVDVVYRQRTQIGDRSGGRYFAEGAMSFANFSRPLRHTVLDGHYIDIDMENAHPQILYQLCAKYGQTNTPFLSRLIHEREAVFREIGIESKILPATFPVGEKVSGAVRDEIKALPLKVVNGGGVDVSSSYLRSLKKEMKQIISFFWDLEEFKEYKKTAISASKKKLKERGYENKEGTFINYILCEVENMCLQIADKTLKRTVDILCFDGGMISSKSVETHQFGEDALHKVEEAIREKTGFQMKFTVKPMKEGFTLPEGWEEEHTIEEYLKMIEPSFIDMDPLVLEHHIKEMCKTVSWGQTDYANAWIAEHGSDDTFFVEKMDKAPRFYIYNESTRFFEIKDATGAGTHVHPHIQAMIEKDVSYVKWVEDKMNKQVVSEEDRERAKKLGYVLKKYDDMFITAKKLYGRLSDLRNIAEIIAVKKDDTAFILSKMNKNEDLLPCGNGQIVELRTGVCRERTKKDYFSYGSSRTFVPIQDQTPTEREWSRTFIQQLLSKCEDGVITPPSKEYMDVFEQTLGYFTTGRNNNKKFYIIYGEGNNGKSTLMGLMAKALGTMYVDAPSKVMLQTKSESNHDTHMYPLIGKRLSGLCEIERKDKLKMDTIKKITGGDALTLRKACEGTNDEGVVFVSKLILASNNIPDFEEYSNDKSVKERLLGIPFYNSFQKSEEKEAEFKSDRTADLFFTYMCQCAKLFYDVKCVIDYRSAPEIRTCTAEIFEKNNVIQTFINTRVKLFDESELKPPLQPMKFKEVKKAFKEWYSIEKNANYIQDDKEFKKHFEECIGIKFRRIGRRNYEIGKVKEWDTSMCITIETD